MSDNNIREFYVPEKPRANADSSKTVSIKAKKYDKLMELIEKDLKTMEHSRDDLINSDRPLLPSKKGYRRGALDIYQIAIFLLSSYLEQHTHENY